VGIRRCPVRAMNPPHLANGANARVLMLPLDYPSRKEFLEGYRRRPTWVRALYDRVVPR